MAELTDQTTVTEFDNNYWYAADLKAFAKSIGVKNSAKSRKDQLEKIIRHYLEKGHLLAAELENQQPSSKVKKAAKTKAQQPHDYLVAPLTASTLLQNYCSNKITKTFIIEEAKRIQPDFVQKSGAWYWLNRWRETQLAEDKKITYGDLVKQFLVLSNEKGRLPQIPSTKMNNFITDFLAAKAGTLAEAREAWQTLKGLNIPKNYEAWQRHKESES